MPASLSISGVYHRKTVLCCYGESLLARRFLANQQAIPYIGSHARRLHGRGRSGESMFSIQNRLKLLFVVIVTLVLAISGSYTQY
jgi:hypothetical protein